MSDKPKELTPGKAYDLIIGRMHEQRDALNAAGLCKDAQIDGPALLTQGAFCYQLLGIDKADFLVKAGMAWDLAAETMRLMPEQSEPIH